MPLLSYHPVSVAFKVSVNPERAGFMVGAALLGRFKPLASTGLPLPTKKRTSSTPATSPKTLIVMLEKAAASVNPTNAMADFSPGSEMLTEKGEPSLNTIVSPASWTPEKYAPNALDGVVNVKVSE